MHACGHSLVLWMLSVCLLLSNQALFWIESDDVVTCEEELFDLITWFRSSSFKRIREIGINFSDCSKPPEMRLGTTRTTEPWWLCSATFYQQFPSIWLCFNQNQKLPTSFSPGALLFWGVRNLIEFPALHENSFTQLPTRRNPNSFLFEKSSFMCGLKTNGGGGRGEGATRNFSSFNNRKNFEQSRKIEYD